MASIELNISKDNESNDIRFIKITIGTTLLKIYSDGKILRKMKEWKEIKNNKNHSKGYNVILIEKKQYMRSKLIAHAFKEISINDKTIYICHKDNNRLNTDINNLIIKKKGL